LFYKIDLQVLAVEKEKNLGLVKRRHDFWRSGIHCNDVQPNDT
jgi:hypothetical protein